MKDIYLFVIRNIRRALFSFRTLSEWRVSKDAKPFEVWLRSLLSIYDLEDLIQLDVPWWTFRSSDLVERYLKTRNLPDAFEWGSGASSVWLSKRCSTVTSVEHDPQWAAVLSAVLPANVDLRLVTPSPEHNEWNPTISRKKGYRDVDFGEYVEEITRVKRKFDLIVVDGRARQNCFEIALDNLKPGGMILFDNVGRRRYRKAIKKRKNDVDVLWTAGLTPCLPYPTRTALISLKFTH
jgi:predicted O-methyltransferase YrrM